MDVVDSMEKAHESTLSANTQSQDHVHRAFQEIREILKGELQKNDLSWDEKKFLIEQIQETGRQQSQKDTENKRFLDSVLGKVLLGTGAALAAGLIFVGAKVIADQLDIPESVLKA